MYFAKHAHTFREQMSHIQKGFNCPVGANKTATFYQIMTLYRQKSESLMRMSHFAPFIFPLRGRNRVISSIPAQGHFGRGH